MLRELSVTERRYQAVLAVIEDGLEVAEVAVKAGVSRQTLHAWLSRYAEGGLEALADRSHRPRSCPHQMDPAVEVRLVELRGLHPGWGAGSAALPAGPGGGRSVAEPGGDRPGAGAAGPGPAGPPALAAAGVASCSTAAASPR